MTRPTAYTQNVSMIYPDDGSSHYMEACMTKTIATAVVAGALALAPGAYAGNAGEGSGYGTQPGFDVATGHTVCAGHGAFGYLGKDFNMAGGANGSATGWNNASLCGNRQGNLPY
jgi:hypothetical protein